MKTIFLAVLAMAAGTALGFYVCAATVRYLCRLRPAKSGGDTKKKGDHKSRDATKKMGVMDKVLILEGVILVVYTITDMVIFWHTSAEPTTLTACVFSVCGIENGVMGWIKTNKDKAADPSGSAAGAAPPPERPELPDVGQ